MRSTVVNFALEYASPDAAADAQNNELAGLVPVPQGGATTTRQPTVSKATLSNVVSSSLRLAVDVGTDTVTDTLSQLAVLESDPVF